MYMYYFRLLLIDLNKKKCNLKYSSLEVSQYKYIYKQTRIISLNVCQEQMSSMCLITPVQKRHFNG